MAIPECKADQAERMLGSILAACDELQLQLEDNPRLDQSKLDIALLNKIDGELWQIVDDIIN